MRNPIWPISIALLSLVVIAAAAFVLHGPLHPDFAPRSTDLSPPLQPLVLKGLRELYLIPAGFVVVFGFLAVSHAKSPRFNKWLYMVQLTLGVLFLAILVASGLQARSLFLNGPPPPEWLGPGEPPEWLKARMKKGP